MAFVTTVVEHWLEREIAQWVSLLQSVQLQTTQLAKIMLNTASQDHAQHS